MTFADAATLGEARDWLRAHVEHGEACPCCTQFAKIYRRKINRGMAKSLVRMYRAARLEWQHIPTSIPARSREEGKLRYWGLVQEADEEREDGGRAGWWRVTPLGEQWLCGTVTVPSHCRLYDGRLLSLVGEPTTISDALGEPFDLRELMGWGPADGPGD